MVGLVLHRSCVAQVLCPVGLMSPRFYVVAPLDTAWLVFPNILYRKCLTNNAQLIPDDVKQFIVYFPHLQIFRQLRTLGISSYNSSLPAIIQKKGPIGPLVNTKIVKANLDTKVNKLGQHQSQTPISSAFWFLDQNLMSRHLPDTPQTHFGLLSDTL